MATQYTVRFVAKVVRELMATIKENPRLARTYTRPVYGGLVIKVELTGDSQWSLSVGTMDTTPPEDGLLAGLAGELQLAGEWVRESQTKRGHREALHTATIKWRELVEA